MSIHCSLSHKGFTLLGRSSLIFAVFLIILYSSSFWFTYNAANLGLLVILLSLLITHYLLMALESKSTCRLFSFFWKGRPVVIYRDWLSAEENALVFGIYHLLWSAIDSVSLSPFGNLVFKSRALSGPAQLTEKGDLNPPTIVLKVPFAAIDLKSQKDFIALLKEKAPQAKLGASLNSLLDKRVLNSTKYIQIFTLLIFLAILVDVGCSTFTYVELLKRYYLSHKLALEGSIDESEKEYDSAEWLRTHPAPYSLISPKLLNNSNTAAGIQESRSKVLWDLGKKSEALLAQAEAVKLAPKSFKINLRQARLYAALGQINEAQKTIEDLTEKHKHALLPRLYSASLLLRANQKKEAQSILEKYLSFIKDDYFSPPPVWPPVGEDAIHELFYQEDLEFLLPSASGSPAKQN